MGRKSITDAAAGQTDDGQETEESEKETTEDSESSSSDETKRYSQTLPEDLADDADDYVDESSLFRSRNHLVEHALDQYLKEEGARD